MNGSGSKPLPPIEAVAYVLILGEQNPHLLDEFYHSLLSLRRFHPELPVMVYHDGLDADQLAFITDLPYVMGFAAGVDRSERFARNRYDQRFGWTFPELFIHAIKIDVLLLTPGNTLYLDTDTEVIAPLDPVFGSANPWMHEDEGLLTQHDRDWTSVTEATNWQSMGWRGDPQQLRMFNAGAVYVPQAMKPEMYRAKEYLWALSAVPSGPRGDNRLDEQIAVSFALQEASDYSVSTLSPMIDHYWREKYEVVERRHPRYFTPELRDGRTVLVPPQPGETPERAPRQAGMQLI